MERGQLLHLKMKIKTIKVPLYRYNIILLKIKNHNQKNDVLKYLKDNNVADDVIEDISSKFDICAQDGALTIYSDNSLYCYCIVFPHTTTKELVSTYIHEGRHITDRILELMGIDDIEASAYLNEFVTINFIEDYINEKV